MADGKLRVRLQFRLNRSFRSPPRAIHHSQFALRALVGGKERFHARLIHLEHKPAAVPRRATPRTSTSTPGRHPSSRPGSRAWYWAGVVLRVERHGNPPPYPPPRYLEPRQALRHPNSRLGSHAWYWAGVVLRAAAEYAAAVPPRYPRTSTSAPGRRPRSHAWYWAGVVLRTARRRATPAAPPSEPQQELRVGVRVRRSRVRLGGRTRGTGLVWYFRCRSHRAPQPLRARALTRIARLSACAANRARQPRPTSRCRSLRFQKLAKAVPHQYGAEMVPHRHHTGAAPHRHRFGVEAGSGQPAVATRSIWRKTVWGISLDVNS